MAISELTDEQLERRVAKQNRRSWRNKAYRDIYRILSQQSYMRLRSTAGTMKAAAKKIAMALSQSDRKAGVVR